MIETTALRRKLLDLAISGKLVPKTGEWKTVRLAEVTTRITDGTHKTPHYIDKGVRFVSAKDVVDGELSFEKCRYISESEHQMLCTRCKPEKGDVLLTKSGSIGAVAVVETDDEFSLFESLALVKFEQRGIDSHYLKHALQYTCSRLSQDQVKGVAVRHLHLEVIRDLPISLPPLSEQKAIVKRLEDLLALEREIAADSAALDDLITAAKRKILDLAISCKLVPKTGAWRTVRLLDVCDRVHYGFTASSGVEGNAQLLRITDIQDGHVAWENVPYCMVPRLDLDRYLLRNGDIVIARTGATVGKSYLVEGLNTLSVFASYLIRVIPNETVSSRFLKIFLDSSLYWRQISEKAVGTGQPNVNAEKLKSLEFPLPPLAEQKAIVKRVEELFAVLDAMKGAK